MPKFFREVDGVQHFISAEERMTAVELHTHYRGLIEWKRAQRAALLERVEEWGGRLSELKFGTASDPDSLDVCTNVLASDFHAIKSIDEEIARYERELAKYPLSVL